MFDPQSRDLVARSGVWKVSGAEVATPAILHAHTARVPAPSWASVLLAEEGTAGGRPALEVPPGFFSPRAPRAGAAAPPLRAPAGLVHAPSVAARLLPETVEAGGLPGAGVMVLQDSSAAARSDGVVALVHARALVKDASRFAPEVVAARRAIGWSALLWTPGLGRPHELALLTYAGVDLFDSIPARVDSRRGLYWTTEGAVPVREMTEAPCACDACGGGPPVAFDDLLAHNLEAQAKEAARVRDAIRRGVLRELAEVRSASAPHLAALLRRFDLEHAPWFEPHAPATRAATLACTSERSLTRPEVARFRRRLLERYRAPPTARVLLLVPCSHRKPYSDSRTHRAIDRALDGLPNHGALHRVVVTSPLGAVPEEIEHAYPAARYDIPVTGHWSAFEQDFIRDAVRAVVKSGRYDHVVAHLSPAEDAIVAGALDRAESTGGADPLSAASLARLRETVGPLLAGAPRVPKQEAWRASMESRARFQFGEAGPRLLEGAEVRGRYPDLKVMRGGRPVATLVPERGSLSLTLDGARILAEAGACRISIEDFVPKGTVFAVGVTDATRDFGPDDEVVVVHGDDVRASGRALMTPDEMVEMERGEAVRVRHHG